MLFCHIACASLCVLAHVFQPDGAAPATEAVMPERGCGASSLFLYTQIVGGSLSLDECMKRLPPSARGVSIADVEVAASELATPLLARGMSARELLSLTAPVVVLVPGDTVIRAANGTSSSMGHFVTVKPSGTGSILVLDWPTKPVIMNNEAQVCTWLGVSSEDAIVVLAPGEPPSGTPADTSRYERASQPTRPAGKVESLDIGQVPLPSPGDFATLEVDLTGRELGSEVSLHILLLNSSSDAVNVSAGESSCSCARFAVKGSLLAAGEMLSVQGKITIGGSLNSRGEYADLQFADPYEEAKTSKLRVHFSGTPAVSVYATPPTVSFGRVSDSQGVVSKEIHINSDAATDEFEVVGITGLPVTVRKMPDPSQQSQTFVVDIRPDGVAKSARSGTIKFASRRNPSFALDVPVFAEVVPAWRCDPPTIVLSKSRTGADVSLVAFDASQAMGIASVRIVGLPELRVVPAINTRYSVRIDDLAAVEGRLYECVLEFEANSQSRRAPLAVIVRD